MVYGPWAVGCDGALGLGARDGLLVNQEYRREQLN